MLSFVSYGARHSLSAVFLVCLIATFLATRASAADRPPTPTHARAGICSPPLSQLPQVCVYFKHEDGDPVGFWFEWTVDGQKMPQDLQNRAYCNYHYASCDALPWFERSPFPQRDYVDPSPADQGFLLRDLPYDTDYCFRFKTISQDNLVSDDWTEWVCARTPPPPPPPTGSVANARLSIIPGIVAHGSSIPETPTRILIEWDKPAPQQHVGWFRTDRWITRSGATVNWEQIGRVNPREDDPSDSTFPTTESIDRKPASWIPDISTRYRVCAQNASGEICSQTLSAVDRLATVPGVEQVPRYTPRGGLNPAWRVGIQSPLVEPNPPVLLEPAGGTRAAMGELRVRLDRPLSGQKVEIELTRGGDVSRWTVKVEEALNGVLLPAQLTDGRPGKWSVSAKVIAPFEGPSSASVEIELTNPVANANGPSGAAKNPNSVRRPITPRARALQPR